jgi:DNA-binding protein
MSAEESSKPTEEETKADENKEEEEEPQEEKIYQEQFQNRVIVARNHPLSYYVDRARRILRMEDEIFVSGRGNTISMACTLVEVLKRQKIAVVASISTGMNVEPFFNRAGDPRWSQPVSMITFTLKRGEFAEYVSDYHQRKVIEIFENTDTECTGTLSFDQIAELKVAERFKANEEQTEKAKKFLAAQTEKKLDLPNFIKYASILIHPLLRDKVFKIVLSEEYQIAATEQKSAATAGD